MSIWSTWALLKSILEPLQTPESSEGSEDECETPLKGQSEYAEAEGIEAGQEATARTGHGTRDWFQIGKGVHQGCILSPCLFNLYAEYILRNVGLDEAQAGIKISGRNINNLRYADDTTLRAESEEELKIMMKVKEESEKVDLKLNI